MPQRKRERSPEEFESELRGDCPPDAAQPLLGSEVIVLRAVFALDHLEAPVGTAFELTERGVKATEAAFQPGPVPVVGAAPMAPWARQQVGRIGRTDEVNCRID